MRLILPMFALLTLVAAYVGGVSSRGAADKDLSTVTSFKESLAERDVLIRSYGFGGFLPALNPDNLQEVLEILEENRNWLSRSELRNFMLVWTRFDSPGALNWALSHTGRFKDAAAAAAMWAWAFHDPTAAQHALNSLDAVDATSLIREEFVLGWLWGKKPGAAEYIAQQPNGMARGKAMSALTVALMREGPESVIEWVDAIPEEVAGNYKSDAFQKAGIILAYVDPILASRWIEGHLDRSYSARTLSRIGSQWVEQDSPAALSWLTGLPPTEAVENAVISAFAVWLKRDLEAARGWLLSAAPAAGVDPAIQTLVRRDSRTEPGAALEWAQRIHDPTLRQQVLTRTGQDWFRTDPKAVTEWLSESELPEEIQTAIQNPPKRKETRERSGR